MMDLFQGLADRSDGVAPHPPPPSPQEVTSGGVDLEEWAPEWLETPRRLQERYTRACELATAVKSQLIELRTCLHALNGAHHCETPLACSLHVLRRVAIKHCVECFVAETMAGTPIMSARDEYARFVGEDVASFVFADEQSERRLARRREQGEVIPTPPPLDLVAFWTSLTLAYPDGGSALRARRLAIALVDKFQLDKPDAVQPRKGGIVLDVCVVSRYPPIRSATLCLWGGSERWPVSLLETLGAWLEQTGLVSRHEAVLASMRAIPNAMGGSALSVVSRARYVLSPGLVELVTYKERWSFEFSASAADALRAFVAEHHANHLASQAT